MLIIIVKNVELKQAKLFKLTGLSTTLFFTKTKNFSACDDNCLGGCTNYGAGKCDGKCEYGYSLTATQICIRKSSAFSFELSFSWIKRSEYHCIIGDLWLLLLNKELPRVLAIAV